MHGYFQCTFKRNNLSKCIISLVRGSCLSKKISFVITVLRFSTKHVTLLISHFHSCRNSVSASVKRYTLATPLCSHAIWISEGLLAYQWGSINEGLLAYQWGSTGLPMRVYWPINEGLSMRVYWPINEGLLAYQWGSTGLSMRVYWPINEGLLAYQRVYWPINEGLLAYQWGSTGLSEGLLAYQRSIHPYLLSTCGNRDDLWKLPQ